MTTLSLNNGKTKRPPYSKHLNTLPHGQLLIICTGSDAWNRADSTTWFPGCKVVLPPSDDPAAYDWRAAVNHDVIIGGFGNLEPIGTIARLGGLGCCWRSGLAWCSTHLSTGESRGSMHGGRHD